MLLQVATPALVDDGGRRRNRGSSFTDSGFLVRLSRVGPRLTIESRKHRTISVSRRRPRSFRAKPKSGPLMIIPCRKARDLCLTANAESAAGQAACPFRRLLHSL